MWIKDFDLSEALEYPQAMAETFDGESVASSLELELSRELSAKHTLKGCSFIVLAKNDDDRKLLSLVTRVLARAVAAPPGVPKAHIQALRMAFDKTMKDKAYLAEMKNRRLAIENPMSGAEVARYIDGIASTPKRIVKRYIAAVKN